MREQPNDQEEEDFIKWIRNDYNHEEEAAEEEESLLALSLSQKIRNLITRCLFAPSCTIFYILMVFLNLLLIAWIFWDSGYPTHWLFIAIEVFINCVLCGEVLLRMLIQKKRFFKSKANLFDVLVSILCVASLIVYFSGPSTLEEVDDAVAVLLLILRYGVQFLRLILLIKNNREKLTSSCNRANNIVDFASMMVDTGTTEGLSEDGSTSERTGIMMMDMLETTHHYHEGHQGSSSSNNNKEADSSDQTLLISDDDDDDENNSDDFHEITVRLRLEQSH